MFAYTSTLWSIIKGIQDRNPYKAGIWRQELIQNHGVMFLTGLVIMTCPACFLVKTRTTSPDIAAPTPGWALPHQLIKLPYRLSKAQYYGDISLVEFPSTEMILVCAKFA